MAELIDDFSNFLTVLFVEGKQKIFTLFALIGILLFLFPDLCDELVHNEVLTRIIGVGIFFISFILSNFIIYRKFAELNRKKASILLAEEDNFFNPSTGSRRSPFKDFTASPRGFNKQGLPDWGSLYAEIHVKNIGYEEGKLVWEYNRNKSDFPNLINKLQVEIDFNPPNTIHPRKEFGVALYFDVRFSETDPREFAKALKKIVKNGEEYKVTLTYRTRRIDGITSPRNLEIKGKFEYFLNEVLQYWEGYGHQDLVNIVIKD
jgi:hypothetical protein